jgi:hypothetical protein
MSKHRARSNDRGSGECLADRGLAGGLGTIESGRRGWRSVEVRYVDQPGNADARGDLGDASSTFGVYVVKSEISSSPARAREREREARSATASARRKEREKNLAGHTLSRNHGRRGCTRCRSAGRTLRSVPRCGCPIPAKMNKFFFYAKGSFFFERMVRTEDGRTIETICPRSPVTFKCRLSSSSR